MVDEILAEDDFITESEAVMRANLDTLDNLLEKHNMAERTHDQILDEMVHAVACVAWHYGPGLNESGLKEIRDCLNLQNTDACYSVDCREDDPYVDFHQRIIWLDDWDQFDTLQTGREV